MKQWVLKIIEQLDGNWDSQQNKKIKLSEDRETLLYIMDIFSKNLIDFDKYPIRKSREEFDHYSKGLLNIKPEEQEKFFFNLRQYLNNFRTSEHSYIQNTFNDFKKIIWNFADQIGEDINFEKKQDQELQKNFDSLREAVESNSIEELRKRSKEFIDSYIEKQNTKIERQQKKLASTRKSIQSIKKQLMSAQESLNTDHLTQAQNRKSFEEHAQKLISLAPTSKWAPVFVIIDIDHFKKINDTYGHDIGDYVLKECVKVLKHNFSTENEFIARLGGEEFAVLFEDTHPDVLKNKLDKLQDQIRKDVLIHGEHQIKFTVSMGVGIYDNNETIETWYKRTDAALYFSKNSGRNQWNWTQNHHQLKTA